MDLDLFAEYFTTHIPITALVYDNRCLGASEGKPRFELIPSFQMSDLQDAITYAQSLEEVDPEKIALWGTSYSGGNVLHVAAFDHRVKAVLAQNPMVSGVENSSRLVTSIMMPEMRKLFEAGIHPQINFLTASRSERQDERGATYNDPCGERRSSRHGSCSGGRSLHILRW